MAGVDQFWSILILSEHSWYGLYVCCKVGDLCPCIDCWGFSDLCFFWLPSLRLQYGTALLKRLFWESGRPGLDHQYLNQFFSWMQSEPATVKFRLVAKIPLPLCLNWILISTYVTYVHRCQLISFSSIQSTMLYTLL